MTKKKMYKETRELYVPEECDLCAAKVEGLSEVRSGCPSLGWVYYYACPACVEEVVLRGRKDLEELRIAKGGKGKPRILHIEEVEK